MRVRNRMQLRARALREIRALRAAEKAKQQPQQETPLAPCVVRRGAKRQRPATPTEDTGGVSEEAQRAKRGADAASPAPGARCSPLLQAAVSPEDHISETNWLTGTLIDLVLWRLAQLYPAVHFLPTAFYHLHLEGTSRLRRRSNGRDTPAAVAAAADTVNDRYQVRDILGRQVDYTLDTPIVFIVNVGHIHWNLFRVTLSPTAKLQLFEPMGYAIPLPFGHGNSSSYSQLLIGTCPLQAAGVARRHLVPVGAALRHRVARALLPAAR
jgi:hypothetical protein